MAIRIGRNYEMERQGLERSMFIQLDDARRVALTPAEFVQLKKHVNAITIREEASGIFTADAQ